MALDSSHHAMFRSVIEQGEHLRKAGRIEQAIEVYLCAASSVETPPAEICLKVARCYRELGSYAEARRWAVAVLDAGDDFGSWQAAAMLIQKCEDENDWSRLRAARLALLGSYTTSQLATMLRIAALRLGIRLEVYESNFAQYRQEILDPDSKTYEFKPDFILLAVHEGEIALPDYSVSPRETVEDESERWTSLWHISRAHSSARMIQHNFVIPCEAPVGHLGARLPGSRYMMTQALNARLGERAGDEVLIVDCERLASLIGKRRWFDPRYWHLSKQAVALEALPLLARHTAAVIAADLGLTRKCMVLDLDNTLWGGVIGEDGLAGIRLGSGAEGEAFVNFQEYILKLKNRGVILAVSSKNNEPDAKEPFVSHPEMRIKLDDIAMFVANWETKADGIRAIARGLNIGLDSIVFVDDNPVERLAVRQSLPEVDVVELPSDPALYTAALSEYLLFETSSFTREDSERTRQYKARAEIARLEHSASSIEDFYRSLQMQAIIESFNDLNLPRIAQLVSKTNQFNLTTRRHSLADLHVMAKDPSCVHFSLRLRDRLTDHGLVAVIIAFVKEDLLDIDTWLMSCRVIGRTVEAEMLRYLCLRAEQAGCERIRGTYIPSAKNGLVKDLFAGFDFDLQEDNEGATRWVYDLKAKGIVNNGFIKAVEHWESGYDVARTN